jgi:mono/diheme cytochrome c family protein
MILLALVLIGLWLPACGGSQAVSNQAAPAEAVTATPFSTHVFGQPTTIIKKEDASEKAGTPAPGAEVDLSRGERTYQSKGCADCHGARGEGVEGKGNPLAGTQLAETEFTDILRTGGHGQLGNDHLFGVQAISPSGMEALYAFVKSLQ